MSGKPERGTTGEQLAAYRSSEYRVQAEPEFVLRIGEPSAALDRLLEQADAATAAFVTAANPHSQPRPMEENLAALERLKRALRHPFVDGEGRSADRAWREPSVLVLGMARAEAEALGREYGQNAIVFAEKGRAPELVLLA